MGKDTKSLYLHCNCFPYKVSLKKQTVNVIVAVFTSSNDAHDHQVKKIVYQCKRGNFRTRVTFYWGRELHELRINFRKPIELIFGNASCGKWESRTYMLSATRFFDLKILVLSFENSFLKSIAYCLMLNMLQQCNV